MRIVGLATLSDETLEILFSYHFSGRQYSQTNEVEPTIKRIKKANFSALF